MGIAIKPIQKRDFGKAISFAITGMQFARYMDSPWLLRLYGRYFWYMELARASQVIAAYDGDTLAGVLLADMRGEPKACRVGLWRAYGKLIDAIQQTFFRDGVAPYNRANEEMYREFLERHTPDGEICFLAADPSGKVKGVGTLLLEELERREQGKHVFLYTDSNCTYQFYEHRGFTREAQRQVDLEFHDKGEVPLACYLYSKVCGEGNTQGHL